MNERELLLDCLHRLNRLPVAYYLTGSMASNYWGIPRTTHDLDFVVQLAPSSIPALLREFTPDYYLDESAIRAAYQPPHQLNAIDTRSALKVDFWLPKPAPFDREMLHRRRQVTLFGEPAWISTPEDVILHKLIWNRITPSNRQLGDAAGIVAVQGTSLDTAYLKNWAAELDVTDDLVRLLAGKIQPKQT
jgi:hypothetical protein